MDITFIATTDEDESYDDGYAPIEAIEYRATGINEKVVLVLFVGHEPGEGDLFRLNYRASGNKITGVYEITSAKTERGDFHVDKKPYIVEAKRVKPVRQSSPVNMSAGGS